MVSTSSVLFFLVSIHSTSIYWNRLYGISVFVYGVLYLYHLWKKGETDKFKQFKMLWESMLKAKYSI